MAPSHITSHRQESVRTTSRRARARPAPLVPRLQFARSVLVMVLVITACLVLHLVLVSGVQQWARQDRAFDHLRVELAQGTAPTGPVDADGHALARGRPLAYIEVPALGLRQVVVEGTSSAELFDGPGHRRDTPLPGQAGTSVIMGRRAAFGGPFRRIARLEPGQTLKVTTGQGEFTYRIDGVRRAGDRVRAGRPGVSRLILATADGPAFVPSGLLEVDASLITPALAAAEPAFSAASLPAAEMALAGDPSTVWALALWLQVVLALALGLVWAWHRIGSARSWIFFMPPLALSGLAASGEVARLLPNLL